MYREFDKYLEKLAGKPAFIASYEQYFRDIENSNTKLAGKSLPTVFHPVVITNKDFQFMKSKAEKMAEILLKTVDIYLNNQEVQDFFEFPATLQEWIEINPGYRFPFPISRYDAFYKDGEYKFCEFNTDGTSGMNEVNTLEEIYLGTETGQDLQKIFSLEMLELRKATLDAILKNYCEFLGKDNLEGSKKPNIAIVDFKESATISEFKVLREVFNKCGVPTEICDARELKYRKGSLWYNNYKIDLIYRRAVTDEMLQNRESITDLIAAYKDGAVCIVGPLRSQIIHSKLIFTFLSNPLAEKYFPNEEIDFIKTHIPRTRRLTSEADLIKEILHNKDYYVLKPHNAYGSKGVYSGSEFSNKEWAEKVESLVESGQHKNYLVQRKIQLPEKEFIIDPQGNKQNFKVSLAPYVFNGKLQGFYTRISEVDVITTNLGGKILPLFVSEK